jgi:hypothetical protein
MFSLESLPASEPEPGGALPFAEFFERYSRYVDGFLARRSVLDASLFPRKPAQMYFGYDWVAHAAPALTDWLADAVPAEELGRRCHRFGSPMNALSVTGIIWEYLMGVLGMELTGKQWSRREAEDVLTYWQRVFESYARRWDPASVPPAQGEMYRRLHVLEPEEAAGIVGAMEGGLGQQAQKAVAAASTFSWLLECESRQNTFNHGLYSLEGTRQLFVKEFVDLSGRFYPWFDGSDLPKGPVSIAFELDGVRAEFDAFGVPTLDPEAYVEYVGGVAVIAAGQVVPEPGAWLKRLTESLKAAHRQLFRTVMTWESADQFRGGARSYARIIADVLEVAGATAEEVDRLAFASLDKFSDESLDLHLANESTPAIWEWVALPDRPTVFQPVLAAIKRGS